MNSMFSPLERQQQQPQRKPLAALINNVTYLGNCPPLPAPSPTRNLKNKLMTSSIATPPVQSPPASPSPCPERCPAKIENGNATLLASLQIKISSLRKDLQSMQSSEPTVAADERNRTAKKFQEQEPLSVQQISKELDSSRANFVSLLEMQIREISRAAREIRGLDPVDDNGQGTKCYALVGSCLEDDFVCQEEIEGCQKNARLLRSVLDNKMNELTDAVTSLLEVVSEENRSSPGYFHSFISEISEGCLSLSRLVDKDLSRVSHDGLVSSDSISICHDDRSRIDSESDADERDVHIPFESYSEDGSYRDSINGGSTDPSVQEHLDTICADSFSVGDHEQEEIEDAPDEIETDADAKNRNVSGNDQLKVLQRQMEDLQKAKESEIAELRSLMLLQNRNFNANMEALREELHSADINRRILKPEEFAFDVEWDEFKSCVYASSETKGDKRIQSDYEEAACSVVSIEDESKAIVCTNDGKSSEGESKSIVCTDDDESSEGDFNAGVCTNNGESSEGDSKTAVCTNDDISHTTICRDLTITGTHEETSSAKQTREENKCGSKLVSPESSGKKSDPLNTNTYQIQCPQKILELLLAAKDNHIASLERALEAKSAFMEDIAVALNSYDNANELQPLCRMHSHAYCVDNDDGSLYGGKGKSSWLKKKVKFLRRSRKLRSTKTFEQYDLARST